MISSSTISNYLYRTVWKKNPEQHVSVSELSREMFLFHSINVFVSSLAACCGCDAETLSVNELGSVGGSFVLRVGLPHGTADADPHKRRIKIEKLRSYLWALSFTESCDKSHIRLHNLYFRPAGFRRRNIHCTAEQNWTPGRALWGHITVYWYLI